MTTVVFIGPKAAIETFLSDSLEAVRSSDGHETSVANNAGDEAPIVFRFEVDEDPDVQGLFAEVER